MAFSLVSCVGTVEDLNPSTSKGVSVGGSILSFEGIQKAVPIANDKIDVFFFPANTDPRDVTYVINYDGATVPVTVTGASIRPDYRGFLKYTIDGLKIDTKYVFSVQAIDNKTGAKSANDAKFLASTFRNPTSHFYGVTTVENLPGADGRTALIVNWAGAPKYGSVASPDDRDVSQYEIVLLDADSLTPVAFDDPTFVIPLRKVELVDGDKVSHQVNGLQPGTKYYVRVRAINQGYITNSADAGYKKEENSNYALVSTLSEDLSAIDVDLKDLVISAGSGSAGLYSFNLEWDPAQGPIDHYRVYYKKRSEGGTWASYRTTRDNVCDGVETGDNAYSCKKLIYTASSTTITDLTPYTDYDIYVVICTTAACESSTSLEYTSAPPYKTDPGLANFGGIIAIDNPKNSWALDEVYLRFDPPDITSGVVDGLIVEAKGSAGSPITNNVFLNHPTVANSSSLVAGTFDFVNDTEVSVRGVDTTGAATYCFSLLPYVWEDGSVSINRSNERTVCANPQVLAPTLDEFGGAISASNPDPSTNSFSIFWQTPSGGIYDKFVVFVRTTNGTFSFSDAMGGDANYIRVEVDYGETSYTLPFPSAGTYQLGVLTYYSNDNIYSQINTNIFSVTVN
ncbi:fibronectin type III domain-containing protein [Halobacteriovorax sp. GB3]|uniref:fibronectin type III domain-containing protein n=1 Tax=Halobacteriovorax sp. GB3 TaxID=2719615 RepID=UPI00235F693D|nr:fibronectin type III domain-containing protein [Halobacteriovorax sp. GB3]MDD0854247.1 fibronectin type III domain-containing protein [Halobacteriovorax sp. GB3]